MTEAITQIVSLPVHTHVDAASRAAATDAAAPADGYVPTSSQASPATESQLQSAAQAMAQVPQVRQTDLRFQVDKVTEQLVVSVVDSRNGTVLLQMPSAQALSIAQSLETEQMQLLDRKA